MQTVLESPLDHSASFRPRIVAPLLILGTIAVIEGMKRFFLVSWPTPSPVFLLMLACGAFISGLRSGLISSVLVLIYLGFFFNGIDGPWLVPISNPGTARLRMLMMAIVAPSIVLIIGLLKRRLLAVERTNAAMRRRDTEEFLRLATETAGIGIFSYDPAAGGKFIVSAQCRANYGVPADTNLDFDFLQNHLIVPEDRERVRAAVQASLASDGDAMYEIEYRVRRPNDGLQRWVAVRGKALPAADGHRTIVGATIDVTERLEAEHERDRILVAERTARQELERAGRIKDEFLATLSHELRTPLNAIIGWVHLLKTDAANPEMQRTSIEVIERNSKAQLQLIEDLLDVSRIINGKMRLKVRPVVLTEVINAAMETARPGAAAREIQIEAVLDPDLGTVSGDPDRLQQIVWNLLSNAVKFTLKGGNVQVRLEREGSLAHIIVKDSGQGIDAEFLPHIFERFRQADSSSTRSHNGLGIGLALVRHLVELHGGTVQAESEGAGKGATFKVSLPLPALALGAESASGKDGAEIAEESDLLLEELSAGKEASVLGGIRILAVDDDPDSRELLYEILSAHGASVTTASSAAEGLTAMREVRPALLLSDIEMPHEDGYGMIAKVRRMAAADGGAIPAVALTAYARKDDERRALEAGFQRHVPKPVQPRELVALVAGLVGRSVEPAALKG